MKQFLDVLIGAVQLSFNTDYSPKNLEEIPHLQSHQGVSWIWLKLSLYSFTKTEFPARGIDYMVSMFPMSARDSLQGLTTPRKSSTDSSNWCKLRISILALLHLIILTNCSSIKMSDMAYQVALQTRQGYGGSCSGRPDDGYWTYQHTMVLLIVIFVPT